MLFYKEGLLGKTLIPGAVQTLGKHPPVSIHLASMSESSKSSQTFQPSGGTSQEGASPLQALYAGATMSADTALPLDYGDFAGEVAVIEEGLGVLPLTAGAVLMVQGEDAALFLNGLTTNDVKKMALGAARNHLLCATKGKIRHHLILIRNKADFFLLLTEPGEGEEVGSYLNHYHIRESLQLGMVSLVRLDVLGPALPAALERLGVGSGMVSFAGAPLVAARLDVGTVPRACLLLPPTTAPALLKTLLGKEHGGRLVGMAAYDEARLWAGIPRYGVDYGRDHLPAEAALYDHISFEKGCYTGQEIHARMHYRGHPNRKLAAVILPAAVAESLGKGGTLYQEGEEVGTLTGLSRLPRHGEQRGIAMLRYRLMQKWPPLACTPSAAPEVRIQPLASDLGGEG